VGRTEIGKTVSFYTFLELEGAEERVLVCGELAGKDLEAKTIDVSPESILVVTDNVRKRYQGEMPETLPLNIEDINDYRIGPNEFSLHC
jgi:hypothetical protein